MPSLSLRINLDPDGRIGPGKIELLEQIAAFGSISAAARGMEMSLLIDKANATRAADAEPDEKPADKADEQ